MHRYRSIDIDPYAHTEICLHIHLLREKPSLSALPRLLTDALGSGDHAVLWHKKSHPASAGLAHASPLLPAAPALQREGKLVMTAPVPG